jgi:hypothetical protein
MAGVSQQRLSLVGKSHSSHCRLGDRRAGYTRVTFLPSNSKTKLTQHLAKNIKALSKRGARMNSRSQSKRIQDAGSTRFQGDQPYMVWQNLIWDECHVKCSVKVELNGISIRTESYADYCMAAALVRKRTSLEVARG